MGIGTGHSIADGDITGQELLISELPVQPSMSADDLQKRFDALGLFIKGKYNALVADLETAFTAAGITNNVLLKANTPDATDVAGQLAYLLFYIDSINTTVTQQTIGEGTITDAMLSGTATEIKKRVANHLGGVTKHTVAHLPTGTTASTVALGNHTHSGYAATSHDHDASDVNTGTLAFARLPTGTTSTTVAKGDHDHNSLYFTESETTTLLAGKANSSHTHATTAITSGEFAEARIPLLAISKISGLQTALDGKQAKIDGAASTVTANDLAPQRVLYSDNNGKIAASSLVDTTKLNHLSGVTAPIQTQLDAKQAAITGAATSITSSNLTGLRALISNDSGKVTVSSVTSGELYQLNGIDTSKNIQAQLNSKSASDHKHSGADITSGTVPVARLPIIYSGTTPTYAAGIIWLKPIT